MSIFLIKCLKLWTPKNCWTFCLQLILLIFSASDAIAKPYIHNTSNSSYLGSLIIEEYIFTCMFLLKCLKLLNTTSERFVEHLNRPASSPIPVPFQCCGISYLRVPQKKWYREPDQESLPWKELLLFEIYFQTFDYDNI